MFGKQPRGTWNSEWFAKSTEEQKPFHALVGLLLTPCSKDEHCGRTFQKLQDAGLIDTPATLAHCKMEDIKKACENINFCNVKASNLINIARDIEEKFGI